MRYTVRKSIVQIVGYLWMPQCKAATEQSVSSYDIENMTDDDGNVTRDSVEQWVMTHSGDFSSVIDFRADLEVGDKTIVIDWEKEESECDFADCMYPAED
jgi:hypothetical protein